LYRYCRVFAPTLPELAAAMHRRAELAPGVRATSSGRGRAATASSSRCAQLFRLHSEADASWLEQRAATDPGLRFVELPALGLRWQPARPAIGDGMAAAVRDKAVQRPPLTVYTDLRRVTVPPSIDDGSTDSSGTGRLAAAVRRHAGLPGS
jgi:hypothetical protein